MVSVRVPQNLSSQSETIMGSSRLVNSLHVLHNFD